MPKGKSIRGIMCIELFVTDKGFLYVALMKKEAGASIDNVNHVGCKNFEKLSYIFD